uniref:Putative zinc metalloprotease MAC_05577 n=1 Tax=Anthurium amnicola TaxID=1678845 RepID=A0A1D1YSE6_9ARAE
MAGLAALLDLLKRNNPSTCVSPKSLHPCGLLSVTVAASAAAAAGSHFAPRGFFSGGGISVAFCDAGAEWREDYVPSVESAYEKIPSGRSAFESNFYHDLLSNRTKEYPIELKPLFSAFGLKSLAITSLRSFLLFYLPLLEPRPSVEEDDDFLQDASEEESMDLVLPFKKSLKQIARETTVVTTRRVLERLAVHYVSQRMAWKLLKDVPRSAKRKAARGLPATFFLYSVSRTTFRGHFLAVAASWIVQVGIDIYRCFFHRSDDDEGELSTAEKYQHLAKRVYGATIKCSASLVFASLGAGICAYFHPSIGQWIGCALGDLGGPIIVTFCCERFLHAVI